MLSNAPQEYIQDTAIFLVECTESFVRSLLPHEYELVKLKNYTIYSKTLMCDSWTNIKQEQNEVKD